MTEIIYVWMNASRNVSCEILRLILNQYRDR